MSNSGGGTLKRTKSWETFELISENIFVSGDDYANDSDSDGEDETMRCNCKPSTGSSLMCLSSRCANYGTQVECIKCHPSCGNNRLLRKKYKNIEVRNTNGGKGHGLYTLEKLSKGDLVTEYLGEIISDRELQDRFQRLQTQYNNDSIHLYVMQIKNRTFVDSRYKGSFARFLNHSCEPNCILEVWTVANRLRLAIFANQDIEPNDELTLDYQWKPSNREPTVCLCAKPSCRGYIEIFKNVNDAKTTGKGNQWKNPLREKKGRWISSSERLFLNQKLQQEEGGSSNSTKKVKKSKKKQEPMTKNKHNKEMKEKKEKDLWDDSDSDEAEDKMSIEAHEKDENNDNNSDQVDSERDEDDDFGNHVDEDSEDDYDLEIPSNVIFNHDGKVIPKHLIGKYLKIFHPYNHYYCEVEVISYNKSMQTFQMKDILRNDLFDIDLNDDTSMMETTWYYFDETSAAVSKIRKQQDNSIDLEEEQLASEATAEATAGATGTAGETAVSKPMDIADDLKSTKKSIDRLNLRIKFAVADYASSAKGIEILYPTAAPSTSNFIEPTQIPLTEENLSIYTAPRINPPPISTTTITTDKHESHAATFEFSRDIKQILTRFQEMMTRDFALKAIIVPPNRSKDSNASSAPATVMLLDGKYDEDEHNPNRQSFEVELIGETIRITQFRVFLRKVLEQVKKLEFLNYYEEIQEKIRNKQSTIISHDWRVIPSTKWHANYNTTSGGIGGAGTANAAAGGRASNGSSESTNPFLWHREQIRLIQLLENRMTASTAATAGAAAGQRSAYLSEEYLPSVIYATSSNLSEKHWKKEIYQQQLLLSEEYQFHRSDINNDDDTSAVAIDKLSSKSEKEKEKELFSHFLSSNIIYTIANRHKLFTSLSKPIEIYLMKNIKEFMEKQLNYYSNDNSLAIYALEVFIHYLPFINSPSAASAASASASASASTTAVAAVTNGSGVNAITSISSELTTLSNEKTVILLAAIVLLTLKANHIPVKVSYLKKINRSVYCQIYNRDINNLTTTTLAVIDEFLPAILTKEQEILQSLGYDLYSSRFGHYLTRHWPVVSSSYSTGETTVTSETQQLSQPQQHQPADYTCLKKAIGQICPDITLDKYEERELLPILTNELSLLTKEAYELYSFFLIYHLHFVQSYHSNVVQGICWIFKYFTLSKQFKERNNNMIMTAIQNKIVKIKEAKYQARQANATSTASKEKQKDYERYNPTSLLHKLETIYCTLIQSDLLETLQTFGQTKLAVYGTAVSFGQLLQHLTPIATVQKEEPLLYQLLSTATISKPSSSTKGATAATASTAVTVEQWRNNILSHLIEKLPDFFQISPADLKVYQSLSSLCRYSLTATNSNTVSSSNTANGSTFDALGTATGMTTSSSYSSFNGNATPRPPSDGQQQQQSLKLRLHPIIAPICPEPMEILSNNCYKIDDSTMNSFISLKALKSAGLDFLGTSKALTFIEIESETPVTSPIDASSGLKSKQDLESDRKKMKNNQFAPISIRSVVPYRQAIKEQSKYQALGLPFHGIFSESLSEMNAFQYLFDLTPPTNSAATSNSSDTVQRVACPFLIEPCGFINIIPNNSNDSYSGVDMQPDDSTNSMYDAQTPPSSTKTAAAAVTADSISRATSNNHLNESSFSFDNSDVLNSSAVGVGLVPDIANEEDEDDVQTSSKLNGKPSSTAAVPNSNPIKGGGSHHHKLSLTRHIMFAPIHISLSTLLEFNNSNSGSSGGGSGYQSIIPPPLVMQWISELILAIHYFHEKGIYLKYLTTDDIYITSEGILKINGLTGCFHANSLQKGIYLQTIQEKVKSYNHSIQKQLKILKKENHIKERSSKEKHSKSSEAVAAASASAAAASTTFVPSQEMLEELFAGVLPLSTMHLTSPEIIFGAIPSEASSIYVIGTIACQLLFGKYLIKAYHPPSSSATSTSASAVKPDQSHSQSLAATTTAPASTNNAILKQIEYLYRILGTPKINHYDGFHTNLPFASILGDKLQKEDGHFSESRSRIVKTIKSMATNELLECYSNKPAATSAVGASTGATTADDAQESDDGGLLDFFKFTLDLVPNHRKSLEYLLKMKIFTHKNTKLQTIYQNEGLRSQVYRCKLNNSSHNSSSTSSMEENSIEIHSITLASRLKVMEKMINKCRTKQQSKAKTKEQLHQIQSQREYDRILFTLAEAKLTTLQATYERYFQVMSLLHGYTFSSSLSSTVTQANGKPSPPPPPLRPPVPLGPNGRESDNTGKRKFDDAIQPSSNGTSGKGNSPHDSYGYNNKGSTNYGYDYNSGGSNSGNYYSSSSNNSYYSASYGVGGMGSTGYYGSGYGSGYGSSYGNGYGSNYGSSYNSGYGYSVGNGGGANGYGSGYGGAHSRDNRDYGRDYNRDDRDKDTSPDTSIKKPKL